MSDQPSLADQKAALEAEIAKLKAEPHVVEDVSLKEWTEADAITAKAAKFAAEVEAAKRGASADG